MQNTPENPDESQASDSQPVADIHEENGNPEGNQSVGVQETQTISSNQSDDDNIDKDIDKDKETANSNSDNATRWKDGDELTFVRVRFPGNSRSFAFLQGKRTFSYGQKVLAMSDRGLDVGYINSFPYKTKFRKSMLPIRSISKIATQEDIEGTQGDTLRQKKAEIAAVKVIERLGLDMQITHVEIIQYGKKMVFYFTAPARVDFRELVKELVGDLKMRIELRQINVRDRAAALGSIGACGQATCCSTFLKNYGNVSIKMAKNQNLALIPTKINGVCGQIKCCIKYEDDVYTDKRKKLPREGAFLKVKSGDIGKVTKLHILIEQFDMITEKGQIRRYAKTEFSEGSSLGRDYKFPNSFTHVVNETSNVIGLDQVAVSMAKSFEKMSQEEIAQANVNSLSTAPPTEEKASADNSDSEKRPPRKNNRNRNRNRKRKPKTDNSSAPKN